MLVVKNLLASAGDVNDPSSIPRLERFPGVGNGNSLQYSCLENPMDRGEWQAKSLLGCKESDTTERLSTHTFSGRETKSLQGIKCLGYVLS